MSESLQDNSECTKFFYGLFIPKEDKQDEDCISVHSVYTDKEEVLRVVKKFKDSRFKAFHTYDEALAFADGDPSLALSPKLAPHPTNADTSNKEIEPPVSEGTNAFKFPKHQELTKLLKAIERGDEQFFVDTVWSNPYFLISSGDTPAILQEGCRYNALHVAAKSSQTQMVVLILETIENPFFLQLLFVDDNEEMCKQRMKYLVDLYLNTPDKAICETPLHFASKFGCSSIVKILTNHPLCEKNPKNKYGETPKEIACSRCSNKNCAELKKEIESYFEPQYYVPILFREDNSTQAILVKPLSYNETHLSQISGTVTSPIVPSMKERAYAGPMPLSQAEEFYKKFKKYNAGDGINLHGTGFSDYEKGLERIGRMLSKELKVKWIEYWPCLNTYCDITSEEGLKLLESFFEEKLNSFRVLQENQINIGNSASSGDLQDDSGNLSKNSSGISILCDAIQNYYLKPEISEDTMCTVSSLTSNEDIFVTPPSSPNSSPYGSVCSLESLDDCPFFVEGFYPTKSDMDILRAIKDIPINADDYPLIYRWKNHILSFPDDISSGWPSPYSPRCASSSSKFADLQNSPLKSKSRSRNIFSIKKNLFSFNPHTDADADIYQ